MSAIEQLPQSAPAKALSDTEIDLEKATVDDVIAKLDVQPDLGLSSAEAKQLLGRYGPNRFGAFPSRRPASARRGVTGVTFRMMFGPSGSANATEALTPIDPKYVTSQFAPNHGQQRAALAKRDDVQPSEIGDPTASSYLGTTSPYYVNNGKLVTEMVGTPFEMTVYKLGDKFYGARSNEFGHVNYELALPIKELNPLDLPR